MVHLNAIMTHVQFYLLLQFSKTLRVFFNNTVCQPQSREITTWAPQTTDILVWKTAYDVQYFIIPSLVALRAEQDGILANPDTTVENRNIALDRKAKLMDGINGWTATLDKNKVCIHLYSRMLCAEVLHLE